MSRLSWLQWTLDDSKLSLTSRIFRTTVSFISAQFRHKMFVKSEPSPLDIYLVSGDLFKIQKSFGLCLATRYRQFSYKIFVRNHFSTEQEKRTHIRLFWSIWNRYFPPFNLQMSSGQLPVTPLLIFGEKRKRNPFKRDKSTSRDFAIVVRSAASRPKQRPLRGLTYSTLKFMRSTCGKSIPYHAYSIPPSGLLKDALKTLILRPFHISMFWVVL